MTESKLWREIRPLFTRPTRPIVQDAVMAVGALPGIDNWDHQIRQHYQAMQVVKWGIPLHFIRDEKNFKALRERVASAICADNSPTVADLSECRAAGLLAALQTRVDYLNQTAAQRVPDLMAYWPDGSLTEVEATSAEKKQGQRTREEAASRLCHTLVAENIPYDVYVHVLDMLSDDEQRDMVNQASCLTPDSSAESYNRWHVHVQTIPARDPKIFSTGAESPLRPSWFPARFAVPLAVYGLVAGPDETGPIPRLFMYWGLTTDAYINPVEKKASRFQGSGNIPHIVAINISALPGALNFYEKILPNHFANWDDISGVLAFELLSDVFSNVYWYWQFFRNPGAKHPISDACAQVLKAGPWKTTVPLYLDSTHP